MRSLYVFVRAAKVFLGVLALVAIDDRKRLILGLAVVALEATESVIGGGAPSSRK